MKRTGLKRVFLLPEQLRIGDVILSTGDEKFSRVIRILDGGPYSHAAIYAGDDRLLESDLHGVVCDPFPRFYGVRDQKRTRLFPIESRGGNVLVLRHPLLANYTDEQLKVAMKILCESQLYSRYAPSYRLHYPLRYREPVRSVVAMLLWIYSLLKDDWRWKVQGKFCSEIVAMYFSNIGLTLFQKGWRPDQISPNDLASGESNLKPLLDAVFDEEDFSKVEDWTHPADDMSEINKANVDVKESTERCRIAEAELKELLDEIHEHNIRQQDSELALMAHKINVELEYAKYQGNEKEARFWALLQKTYDDVQKRVWQYYHGDRSERLKYRSSLQDLTKLKLRLMRHLMIDKLRGRKAWHGWNMLRKCKARRELNRILADYRTVRKDMVHS